MTRTGLDQGNNYNNDGSAGLAISLETERSQDPLPGRLHGTSLLDRQDLSDLRSFLSGVSRRH